jgi:hypothetical protein
MQPNSKSVRLHGLVTADRPGYTLRSSAECQVASDEPGKPKAPVVPNQPTRAGHSGISGPAIQQQILSCGGEHGYSILLPFAVTHGNLIHREIDIFDPQTQCFQQIFESSQRKPFRCEYCSVACRWRRGRYRAAWAAALAVVARCARVELADS